MLILDDGYVPSDLWICLLILTPKLSPVGQMTGRALVLDQVTLS